MWRPRKPYRTSCANFARSITPPGMCAMPIVWERRELCSAQGDDGEPSGTAGLPIYNQLLSFRTTDTLVAVVRYFGGILLGASGLVAAYKQAARMALETSRIEERIVCRKLEVRFGYGQISAVMRLVKERGLDLLEQDLREDCRIRVAVRASAAETVRGALEAIFGVKVSQEPD